VKSAQEQQHRIERMLFELLQGELWGKPLSFTELSHADYVAVMELATQQTADGLVGDCLMQRGVTLQKEDAVNLYARVEHIKHTNAHLNSHLKGFAAFLERHTVKYVIVKGQVIGALYPNPDVRTSGDIDIYCPGDDFAKAMRLIEQRLGRSLGGMSGGGKHVEFTTGKVAYELHHQLTQLATRRHQDYWDKMIAEAVEAKTATVDVNGQGVQTLTATYNVLYVFVHLFFHMTASGVGLRQLCDWAVMLHSVSSSGAWTEANPRDGIDTAKLQEILTALGYHKAFMAMGAFVVECLGLPEKDFPFQLGEKDRRWVSVIRNNILKRGNFGRSTRTASHAGIWHSLETARQNAAQTLIFYRLAPQEVLLRFTGFGEGLLRTIGLKK